MTPELLSLLTQAPPIAVVLIVGLYLIKELNKRDDNWQEFIDKRDEIWREFLKDIIQEQSKAMQEASASMNEASRGTKEAMTALTDQVAKNTATILLHDATVRGINPETIGTTEELVERILGK